MPAFLRHMGPEFPARLPGVRLQDPDDAQPGGILFLGHSMPKLRAEAAARKVNSLGKRPPRPGTQQTAANHRSRSREPCKSRRSSCSLRGRASPQIPTGLPAACAVARARKSRPVFLQLTQLREPCKTATLVPATTARLRCPVWSSARDREFRPFPLASADRAPE